MTTFENEHRAVSAAPVDVIVSFIDRFAQEANEKGYEFFIVVGFGGGGASAFNGRGNVGAAYHARKAHEAWEIEHGIDPYHDRNKAS